MTDLPVPPAEHPSLVADTKMNMLRNDIAEHLGYLATHVGCARSYTGIADDVGLAYALNCSKAYLRAALEAGKMLKAASETAALDEQAAVEWRAERDARRKISGGKTA